LTTNVRDTGDERADASTLNRDILDTFGDFARQLGGISHSIAAGFGVAPSDLVALFKIDGALPMKELARRMGCDASFVTAVADALERHGLARREPGERDRRIKNLVLTPEGIAARERLMRELANRMPWCAALDDNERRCLLSLLRKMTANACPARE
jgi:DNA-binding MarR family transcriptional regulator